MAEYQPNQTVTIMVGVIGSGKSTESKRISNQNPNCIILSKDVYRSMFRDRYIFRNDVEALIRICTSVALDEALRRGFDVVIDETNITQGKRTKLIQHIKTKFPKVIVSAIEFPVGPWCLERRLTDTRGYDEKRWERVYQEMSESFETCTDAEGFDNIRHVPLPTAYEYKTPVVRQREYCQKNKLISFLTDKCPKCHVDMNSLAEVHINAASKLITSCPRCGYAFND